MKLYDIASLIDWANTFESIKSAEEQAIGRARLAGDDVHAVLPDGQVVISATGGVEAYWPAFEVPQRVRVFADQECFDLYNPPKGFVSVVTFLKWLDLVRDYLNPRDVDVLDMALKSITANEGTIKKIEQDGGSINFSAEVKAGVTTSNPVPKRFSGVVPFGDPTILVPVTYVLILTLANGNPVIEVTMLPEPTQSAWIAQAREKLKALPAGWSVIVGP